jgi:NADPH-ferrihemoprotein reductase
MVATSDVVVAAVGITAAGVYIFRDQIFQNKPKAVAAAAAESSSDNNERDFVAKLKAAVCLHFVYFVLTSTDTTLQNKRLVIFYGSQTGTAEEYAIRFAKEAKSKFGLSSLVCDPEEYDFENLDKIPEDCAAVFFMASYGEGEPTDNAVALMTNMADEHFQFANGDHRLDGLKYVLFGLGNRTYEHFNGVARNLDKSLLDAGATRIGERGEGDDDRSMEEDYIEWKEAVWDKLAAALGVEEGAGGDSSDFEVKEVNTIAPEKVYLG